MNLIDWHKRGDAILLKGRELRVTKVSWASEVWRAMEVPTGPEESIVIGRLDSLYPLRSLPEFIGWFVFSPEAEVRVRADLVLQGERLATATTLTPKGCAAPIRLAWPNGYRLTQQAELHLTFESSAPLTRLLVHRVLDRAVLYSMAKGTGIELGPGPRPQILPAADVNVKYLEEMPAEKWQELYDGNGKYGAAKADWSNYVIGTADSIPAEPQSLDFIFSSHVFEHLSNPLGHLKRWGALLRPGGVVLAVVPDVNSTKDVLGEPSTLPEIIGEMHDEIWRPRLQHYERYWQIRGGTKQGALKLYEENSSIHVHFYDAPLMSSLLSLSLAECGFSSYRIYHSQNHKDFYFCLWK